jgi:predicted NBD/HSP70 family sugar kinase
VAVNRPSAPLGSQGSRNDLVRRHNLALVLRRVHVAPTSRSELTRLSGLNRSTIGALVAELEQHELVIEDEASAIGQVGRPSPVVRPSDVPIAIAVNPEIDSVTVAAVLLGGRVLAKERIALAEAPTAEQAVALSAEAIDRVVATAGPSRRIIGVGIAVPGIVRMSDGLVRLAPHLGWRDVSLASMLEAATGLPVSAANDASLGARGEWIFGAGRDAADLIYLNGGASGIGGGIVSGGVLLGGATGHAGELGHAAVRRRGSADTAGASGTLESEVTRAALLRVLGLASADPDELERALLADRSKAVRGEVDRQIDHLAVALGTAVNLLNPSRIVLGGFLAALAAADPELLDRRVAQHTLPALGEQVEIRRAELGSDLLMIGAAELAFERLFADPLIAS